MTAMIRLKPLHGVHVRDPVTGLSLSPDGEEKPSTAYWLRRLRDGDVVAVPAKTEPEKSRSSED